MKKKRLISLVMVVLLFMSAGLLFAEGKKEVAEEKEWIPGMGKVTTENYKPRIDQATKKYSFGFANYMRAAPFCTIVEEGMRKYAQEAGIEIFIVDNEADAAKAVDNARAMITKQVDFFIEYQGHAETNAVIGDMMKENGIPVVAIDIPVQGAPFFGGNNYVAGHQAGEWLGKYAEKNWKGENVVLVLIESTTNGEINERRMQGYIDGVKENFPKLSEVFRLDTDNQYEDAMEKARSWLSGHPDEHHILMGALHDGVGAGGLQALKEANREPDAIIVSQGADPSIYDEIRNLNSAYKGSVAYFPEKYGFYTISIGLDILEGNPIPKEYFVPHTVIDGSNIDDYYPSF
jgi:ribose transport system substrate-binding protein